MTYNDGSSYSGEWKEGRRHGIGVLKYADGSEHKGQWLYDLRFGLGQFTDNDGKIVRGTWQNDRLNGIAKLVENMIEEDVMYKDDLLIKVNNKLDWKEKIYVAASALSMMTTFRYFFRFSHFYVATEGAMLCAPMLYWSI